MAAPWDDEREAYARKALAEAERYREIAKATDYYPSDEGLRIARLNAASVERHRQGVEDGDGEALLAAIYSIATSGGAGFPIWLARVTRQAIDKYREHDAATLDEAFGVKRPSHYRQAKARELKSTAKAAIADIVALQMLGLPTDGNLFEAVGTLYGAGKTKVSEWYYGDDPEVRKMGKIYALVGVRFTPELLEVARSLGYRP